MRFSPRSARVTAVVILGAASALAVACSSSSSEEVLAADAGSDTGSVDAGSVDTGTVDSGGGSDSSVTFDSGPTFDAGQPVVLDAGPGFEGGIPCYAGGVLELEPNESAGSATSFAGTICGVLSAGSGGAGDASADSAADAAGDGGASGVDEDYVTWTFKATTSSFSIKFEGDVIIDISVDGSVVATLQAGAMASIPFSKKPYVAHIKPASSRPAYWKLLVIEN